MLVHLLQAVRRPPAEPDVSLAARRRRTIYVLQAVNSQAVLSYRYREPCLWQPAGVRQLYQVSRQGRATNVQSAKFLQAVQHFEVESAAPAAPWMFTHLWQPAGVCQLYKVRRQRRAVAAAANSAPLRRCKAPPLRQRRVD